MPEQVRAIDIATTVFGPRELVGRWIYLVAMFLPLWVILEVLRSPFPAYGYLHWVAGALVFVCALQFYRPTLALWLPVFLCYTWASAGAVWREIDAFQEFLTFGGEEHGRWEGWHTERMFLALIAFLIFVTIQVTFQIRRRHHDAT